MLIHLPFYEILSELLSLSWVSEPRINTDDTGRLHMPCPSCSRCPPVACLPIYHLSLNSDTFFFHSLFWRIPVSEPEKTKKTKAVGFLEWIHGFDALWPLWSVSGRVTGTRTFGLCPRAIENGSSLSVANPENTGLIFLCCIKRQTQWLLLMLRKATNLSSCILQTCSLTLLVPQKEALWINASFAS